MSLEVTKKTAAKTISAQLFRHAKCPDWGLGVLVHEEQDRRAYRFEDGSVRKIRKGYYDLLEPVEEFQRFEHVHAHLVEVEARGEDPRARSTVAPKAVCSFKDQLKLFKELYPNGFTGPEWIADHRGSTDSARAKRHRNATIVEASKVLDPERCNSLVSNGKHDELTESVAELLAGTDLVPLEHVKKLRAFNADERRAYAEAVAALVGHEPDDFGSHFREYLWTLRRLGGRRPSWRVATALLAIAMPDDHVCVRYSAFLKQAGTIAPKGDYGKAPKLRDYHSFLAVASTVRQKLEAADLHPQDLLDVHDFIWATLRKSALESMAA